MPKKPIKTDLFLIRSLESENERYLREISIMHQQIRTLNAIVVRLSLKIWKDENAKKSGKKGGGR